MTARGAPLRSARGFASRPRLRPSYTTNGDATQDGCPHRMFGGLHSKRTGSIAPTPPAIHQRHHGLVLASTKIVGRSCRMLAYPLRCASASRNGGNAAAGARRTVLCANVFVGWSKLRLKWCGASNCRRDTLHRRGLRQDDMPRSTY